ncbi:TetR/AcrR family transcriptional regulator [Cellulomonas sp. P24]|uniref:TetR/AcrR family transcriptional regulator n=1 Tax=Cellulomonas sp. P24 TaxID=2885206 RepID=UPI00216B558F|nr:TetR/AcrR family transcriptional regulator [Cellulomonas sp. P24]MCR6493539.1 TetR/AcrR family transcriptional regulator [Cellulomonas sp. P24]
MTGTRRRGATLEDAILDAGWVQLIDKGYPGFTFEAIAERAKTGKAALYRRWPDKEALLLAVLAHQGFAPSAEIPDTGSLREDVLTLMRSANRRGEHAAALFSSILSAYFDNEITLTPAQLRTQLFGDQSRALTQVVQHAVSRGDLSPEGLPPQIVRLPSDLLRHELIMTLSRVPDETIVDIVDNVFLPLATDPRRTSRG